MKFTISRDRLESVEILEFKGEFEQLDEIDMKIKDCSILFKTSYLTGEKKPIADHVILQIKEKSIEAVAVAQEHFLFARPPKFISKKKTPKIDKNYS